MSTQNIPRDEVLMMYVLNSTFVKRDISILGKKYSVASYHFNTSQKSRLPLAFIKQFFFLIFKAKSYKAIIIQSSGYISFIPTIFGKLFKTPIIIIAIGTDCAKLPEINYGAHTKKVLSWFTNFSFQNASLILPVHNSLEKSVYTYKKVRYPNQGIRSFNPHIKTKIIETINGYDTKKWIINNNNRIKNSFLTVTFAVNEIGFYRKGIDMILKAATMFPDYSFTIVGKVFFKEECPKNIVLLDNVPQDELLKIYNNHEFYLQLSMFEGFPNALCEAMLCGCIPIGSNVAGIPAIIGKNGYILKTKNSTSLKGIISSLKHNSISTKDVRNQIVENFSIERREKKLINNVTEVINFYM